MDRFSRGFLLVAMCLAVSVSVVTGLQCYSCGYFNLDSSNQAVKTALSSVISGSTDGCKENVMKGQGVDVKNCSSPSSGKKAICEKIDGTVKLSVVTVDVSIQTIYRGCAEVDSNSEDGCEEPSASEDGLSALLSAFSSYSVTGNSCECSSDLCNGQQKVTAEKLCWLAGLLMVFSARYLW